MRRTERARIRDRSQRRAALMMHNAHHSRVGTLSAEGGDAASLRDDGPTMVATGITGHFGSSVVYYIGGI